MKVAKVCAVLRRSEGATPKTIVTIAQIAIAARVIIDGITTLTESLLGSVKKSITTTRR